VGDDEHVLERVGRPRRPALWIGAWVVGLVAIVGLAVVGRDRAGDDLANVPAAPPVASPAPEPTAAAVVIVASPDLPEDLPRVLQPRAPRVAATPRPVPTLGDDGLVGGTVYSSPAPAGSSGEAAGP
jgi:hypothetical protein